MLAASRGRTVARSTLGLAVAAMLLGGWSAMPARSASGGPSVCVDDSTSLARDVRSDFAAFLSSDDPISARIRARWGVARMPEDSAVVVRDSIACRRAVNAYAREESMADSGFRVVLLRMGHRRVVVREDADTY